MRDTMFYSANYCYDAACNTRTNIISTLTGRFFLVGALANDLTISIILFLDIGSFYSHILSKNIAFYSLSLRTDKLFLLNCVKMSSISLNDYS